MQITKQAVLSRVFIGENDRFADAPLHQAIVMKARELFCGTHRHTNRI
jgi:PII-like signaling protein